MTAFNLLTGSQPPTTMLFPPIAGTLPVLHRSTLALAIQTMAIEVQPASRLPLTMAMETLIMVMEILTTVMEILTMATEALIMVMLSILFLTMTLQPVLTSHLSGVMLIWLVAQVLNHRCMRPSSVDQACIVITMLASRFTIRLVTELRMHTTTTTACGIRVAV